MTIPLAMVMQDSEILECYVESKLFSKDEASLPVNERCLTVFRNHR